jgi:hypothetical protein
MASACGWQYLCVMVIELCSAILASVKASQPASARRVSAEWRKEYGWKGFTPTSTTSACRVTKHESRLA